MNEIALRKNLLRFSERQWETALQQFRATKPPSPADTRSKAPTEDARELLRWLDNPKRHVGRLRPFLNEMADAAAESLAEKRLWDALQRPTDPAEWAPFLDLVALQFDEGYARICHLGSPSSVEWVWSVPAPQNAVSVNDPEEILIVHDPDALDGLLESARNAATLMLQAIDSARDSVLDARLVGELIGHRRIEWDAALGALSRGIHGSLRIPGGGLEAFSEEIEVRRLEASRLAEESSRLQAAQEELEYLQGQIASAPKGVAVQFQTMVESKQKEIDAIKLTIALAEGTAGTAASARDEGTDDKVQTLDAIESEIGNAATGDMPTNPREVISELVTELPEARRPESPQSDEPVPATVVNEQPPGEPSGHVDDATQSVVHTEDRQNANSLGAGQPAVPVSPEGVQDIEVALSSLVQLGNWAAAASVVQLTSLDIQIVKSFLYCAEAFSLPFITTDPRELLVRDLETRAQAVSPHGTQRALLTTVATLRTCLELGQNEYTLLDDASFDSLSPEWREAIRVLRSALAAGYRHRWERSVGREINTQPVRIQSEAVRLRDELPHRKISLQRATRVLQHLIKPEEALGAALSAVVGWADGLVSAAQLREHATVLADADAVIKLADSAVSTKQQLRKRIVSSSLDTLNARITEVASVVDRALEADTRRSVDQGSVDVHLYDQVRSAISQIPPVQDGKSLVAGALSALLSWLHEGSSIGPLDEVSFQHLMFSRSLAALSAARDESTGLPIAGAGDINTLLAELTSPHDRRTLFAAYLALGNLPAAAVLSTSDDEPESAVRSRDWAKSTRTKSQSLQALMMRTQAQLGMDEQEQAEIESSIASLESVPRGRFDIADERADTIERRIMSKWEEDEDILRSRLRQLSAEFAIPVDNVRRIEQTIAEHDLITAHEFLSYVENGMPLPSQGDATAGSLDAFRSLLKSLPASVSNVVTQAESMGAANLPRRVEEGLRAWNLARNNARPSDWIRGLPLILGVLGLVHNRSIPISEVRRPEQQRWAATFSVSATPTDGSHVAVLGSKVDRYTVTVVKPDASVESVIETIPAMARRSASILLYPGVLPWQQRMRILSSARRRKVTILIVDTATVLFLAVNGAESFRLLQEVTLPFAVFDHWAPRVAGDVPSELFVGRSREMDQIMSSGGSLFVYGGRQLGKSALLNRIRREFSETDGHIAIYIDLKAAGIGNQNGPEHLWTVLRSTLVDEGVIAQKYKASGPEAITKHIRDWLDVDATRRMLLLCDESDAFLENEARQDVVSGRSVTFPNVMHLKGLMDATGRHFKPVFAGLHQVQRIGDVSNSPLAHGGRDILVGPLSPDEARDLVVRPFEVLGYTFKTLDLVWRLIAFTNYQAGLVQIVCDALIGHLRDREIKDNEPPYVITADDVDHIITDQNIRDQIAERFMLTIRLEDRYFVTALTIALYSLDDGFRKRYSPEAILDGAAEWWEPGFESLNSTQFRFYLDEMVGLGVLMRGADGNYGMRSPNVVHMLGGRDDIERRLIDGADRFELPVEYNPKVSRRLISILRKGRDRQPEKYSPLTEHDLSIVLPKKDDGKSAFAVIGSKALGIESVTALLEDVVRDRALFDVENVPPNEHLRLIQNGSGPFISRPLLICDAWSQSQATDEIILTLSKAALRGVGRRGAVLGPDAAVDRERLETNAVSTVALQLWSPETLRATIENPISDPELRDLFVDACGGWPLLCEQFLDRIRGGQAVADVIGEAVSYPDTSADANEFVASVGLTGAEDVVRLGNLAQLVDDDEEVDLHTFAGIIDLDTKSADAFIDRLLTLSVVKRRRESLVLNSVVARALRLLGVSDGG